MENTTSVYCVTPEGSVELKGYLSLPDATGQWVMRHVSNSQVSRYDGLPWWLQHMRPQGYLGRAFAKRNASQMGLPEHLSLWSDIHVLKALREYGDDTPGNFLIGGKARDTFLNQSHVPIVEEKKPETWRNLALAAIQGEISGSSAAGEQPKFTIFAETASGPQHLIVKFSDPSENKVTERWRDLLLAEHLSLETLRHGGCLAAESAVLDYHGQRFLEMSRFDRKGSSGRYGLTNLSILDAEFVGMGQGGWCEISARLLAEKVVTQDAFDQTALFWAFGSLIGNNDMHGGNLSFFVDRQPFLLAPIYDMLPMAFAPRPSGGMADVLPKIRISPKISMAVWQKAEQLACNYMERLRAAQFSQHFQPCIGALEQHIEDASRQIKAGFDGAAQKTNHSSTPGMG